MFRLAFRLSLLLSASTLLTGEALAAGQTPAWPMSLIDPHPSADDLTLPMPCGGKMVFRPVDVPAGNGFLADTEIKTGRVLDPKSDVDKAYNEFLENDRVAGAFSVTDQHMQRYYIGKYDVTRNQYNTIMKGTCTPGTSIGQLPQTDVSFGDAQDFATRWSSWLLKNASAALPKRSGNPGFIRLPTDAEWSYAAKGGNLNKHLESPMWDMGDDAADEYVVGGAEEGGKAQPVGSKKPNPLGLYDMVGNVSQMVLDPYRLNKINGQQGLSGGILARGGDFHSSPDEISTATRYEMPPFDPVTAAPSHQPSIGFRVVIGALALENAADARSATTAFTNLTTQGTAVESGSLANAQQIEKVRQDAGQAETLKQEIAALKTQLNQAGNTNSNTQNQLDKLQKDANKVSELQQQITSIQTKLAQAGLERLEFQKRQISAQIEGAETLSRVISQDALLVKMVENDLVRQKDNEQTELGLITDPSEQQAEKERYKKDTEKKQEALSYRKNLLAASVSSYISFINTLAEPSNAELLPEQHQIITQTFQNQTENANPETAIRNMRNLKNLEVIFNNIKRATDKQPINPSDDIINPLVFIANEKK